MKYSLFQKQILRFYRDVLKFAYKKPEPLKTQIKTYARKQLELNRNIPRTNITKIEFLFKQGCNQFEMAKRTGVVRIAEV